VFKYPNNVVATHVVATSIVATPFFATPLLQFPFLQPLKQNSFATILVSATFFVETIIVGTIVVAILVVATPFVSIFIDIAPLATLLHFVTLSPLIFLVATLLVALL
jgi:hypothetical protein